MNSAINDNTSIPSADDANTPIEVYGDSPDRVAFPVWLKACIKLAPPKRDGKPRQNTGPAYEIALKLLASRESVRPDEATPLDRQRLARYVGSQHPRNVQWVFDYLAEVGFLRIYKRPDINGGRRPDRFEVRTRPPANYVGPVTDAELDHALFSDEPPKRLFSQGSTESLQTQNFGDPRRSADADVRGVFPGHTESLQTQNFGDPRRSADADVRGVFPGHTESLQTQNFDARTRGIRREGEDPSGSSPEPKEENAGTPAAGAAAGDPLEEHPELLELVLKLDWGKRDDISYEEARKVVSAMAYAQHQLGWGHERITAEAVNAIKHASSNPFSFVAKRFRQGDRLGRLQLAPKDQRLSAAEQQPQGNEQQGGHESAAAATADVFDRVTGEQLPPWCGECNGRDARAGQDKTLRMTADRRLCPACHPEASVAEERQPQEDLSPEELRREAQREARRARRKREGW